MGEQRDLAHSDSIAKIKTIAADEMAMLGTFTANHSLHVRPMGTQGIDDDGTIWFFSQKDSPKNKEITTNPKVQLIYSVSGKSAYLSLEGTATISRDQRKIDELWNAFAKTWFTKGKEDPELTLIAVRPTAGYYWDTKHNKMVSLAMIAIGAAIGKTMDDGVMGQLKV